MTEIPYESSLTDRLQGDERLVWEGVPAVARTPIAFWLSSLGVLGIPLYILADVALGLSDLAAVTIAILAMIVPIVACLHYWIERRRARHRAATTRWKLTDRRLLTTTDEKTVEVGLTPLSQFHVSQSRRGASFRCSQFELQPLASTTELYDNVLCQRIDRQWNKSRRRRPADAMTPMINDSDHPPPFEGELAGMHPHERVLWSGPALPPRLTSSSAWLVTRSAFFSVIAPIACICSYWYFRSGGLLAAGAVWLCLGLVGLWRQIAYLLNWKRVRYTLTNYRLVETVTKKRRIETSVLLDLVTQVTLQQDHDAAAVEIAGQLSTRMLRDGIQLYALLLRVVEDLSHRSADKAGPATSAGPIEALPIEALPIDSVPAKPVDAASSTPR